jgi:hypothetical protein
VTKVVCLNRHGKLDARLRQWRALAAKGIQLPERTIVKLRVTSTDLSEPNLGLTISQHKYLVDITTHIVHNACLRSTSALIPCLIFSFLDRSSYAFKVRFIELVEVPAALLTGVNGSIPRRIDISTLGEKTGDEIVNRIEMNFRTCLLTHGRCRSSSLSALPVSE